MRKIVLAAAADDRDELAPPHCQRLPLLPTERITHPQLRQETAALRDFVLAYDRCGSFSTKFSGVCLSVPSA